jgi:hypothetical protein
MVTNKVTNSSHAPSSVTSLHTRTPFSSPTRSHAGAGKHPANTTTHPFFPGADVGVLLSKGWFEWADEAKLLTAGTRLIFRLRSEVTYKDKVNYRSVAVAGDVFVHSHLGRLVKVAYVDFERDESQGNPVVAVAYIQRYGSAKSAPIPLATEYHLTSSIYPSLNHVPATNEPYSKISGNFNPIHTNPYFAAHASLPGTITHETVVAMGIPDRVLK